MKSTRNVSNVEIAKMLTDIAVDYPWCDEGAKKKTILSLPGFKVKCVPTGEAILKVAERFKKGAPDVGCFKLPRKPNNGREGKSAILYRYRDDDDLSQFQIIFGDKS